MKRPNDKCVKMRSCLSKSCRQRRTWRLDPVAPDQVWALGGSLWLLDFREGELAGRGDGGEGRVGWGRTVRAGGGPSGSRAQQDAIFDLFKVPWLSGRGQVCPVWDNYSSGVRWAVFVVYGVPLHEGLSC